MSKQLRADIIVGGIADGSFYKLGSELQRLGSMVNTISDKLIQFGKESVEAYVSYEDYMLEAEVALRTQYDSASELGRVMDQLDKAALQWAKDSRFTTEDVAGAISNAAHAGWDLEQILNGVPSAMKISLAGGMELAEGLEYLVDISNAAGVGFEDLGELVDYWAFAANRSSTEIPEMGAAMQKMGATMQFVKGDMAALTTMLAVLANNGAKGTEAGTLLRNSFVRLIAPTQKAAEAMADLDLTSDELEEIFGDSAGLENANKLLQEAGFSAYDANGDLKSFMTIWQELDAATSSMSEQDRNTVLSAIFPTRTITGALALLEAAAKDWDGLYSDIQSGSEGYADYAAEKMESGLGGALRHLESVYNALQTRTGEELAEPVSTVANALSTMIDSLNNMDDVSFGALVSGLEVVAAAGPGLTAAGAAIKLIGAVASGSPIAITMLGIGLAAAAAGLRDFNEAMYEDNFGGLTPDMDSIAEYISTLGNGFSDAQENINKYNLAVEQALTDYETASTTFSESILTKMLTHAELTDADREQLLGLGDQMRDALLDGIEGSYSSAMEAVGFFADEDVAAIQADGSSMWSSILDTMAYGYEDAKQRAYELGQGLEDALFAALKDDNQIDLEEYKGLQKLQDAINKEMAINAAAKAATEKEKLMHQAQTLGPDGVREIIDMAMAGAQTQVAAVEEAYYAEYEKYTRGAMSMIEDGAINPQTGQPFTEADMKAGQDFLYYGDPNEPTKSYAGKLAIANASGVGLSLDAVESALFGSELQDVWNETGIWADMLLNGLISPEIAHDLFNQKFGNNQYAGEFDSELNGWTLATQIGKFYHDSIDAFHGEAAVEQMIADLEKLGDVESADRLRKFYTQAQIANDFYSTTPSQHGPVRNIDSFLPMLEGVVPDYSVESARQLIEYMDSIGGGEMEEFFESVANAADTGVSTELRQIGMDAADYIAESLGRVYDFKKVLENAPDAILAGPMEDYYAAWRLMFDETINAEDYRIPVTPEIDPTTLTQLGEYQIPVDIQPKEDGMGLAELENQGVTVDVDGDTTTLSATIDAEDGQTLMEYIDGDPTQLSAKIIGEDGKTLVEFVDGDTSALAREIAKYNGKVITVTVRYKSSGLPAAGGKAFAEGGRATQASIFGEAGPEWAIPEQHTQRTAELLNAAREASGFTWPDLLSRNGGLNAGSKGNWTLVYSPTIVAADATGVEQKLKDDKAKLEKWLRDKQLHDDLEVYS